MELNKHYLIKYIGKTKLIGINNDLIYEVVITKNKYGYNLDVLNDIINDIKIDKMYTYSNEKSIRHNWDL